MIQRLLSLPKNVLVVLALTTAIVFIVLQDPPHTLCRTQINNFKSRQVGGLYKDPKIKHRKLPLMEVLIKACQTGDSPGACYKLFSKIRELIRDLKIVPHKCRSSLAGLSKVRPGLFKTYSLMIRLAWGPEASKDIYGKLRWLSSADAALFCSLQANILALYGQSTFSALEQNTLAQLPGADKMSKNQVRELALVSEDCSIYD